jgi:branched-chain amino acid transport system permease protein
MNFDIAMLLMQDGLTRGAIYVLLALALVMIFAVTRVIFIPQGELVSYGALTLATLQNGRIPGTLWLLVAATVVATALDLHAAVGSGNRAMLRRAMASLAWPAAAVILTLVLAPLKPSFYIQIGLTFLIVMPLGPVIYRLAFQPLQNSSVLVLLIAAMAVHFVLVGLGLVFFGADGWRTSAFTDATVEVGGVVFSGQSIAVIAAVMVMVAALYLFFGRTLRGKALRAAALNRLGARLMGIGVASSGRLAFLVAAGIGVASGVLIAPITTIYYDSGFLIGLMGFVGAICGGLVSYPMAALGAVLVGLLEAWSSFAASAFKDVIVFTLIIPVLLWRSWAAPAAFEDEGGDLD